MHPQRSTSPKSGLSDAWKPSARKVSDNSAAHGGESSTASGFQAHKSQQHQRNRSRRRDHHGDNRGDGKGITLDSIQRQIHHRLATSKENCDRELRKIIVAIYAFVEERIYEQQMRHQQERLMREEQDDLDATTRALSKIGIMDGPRRAENDDDASGEDGFQQRHSRLSRRPSSSLLSPTDIPSQSRTDSEEVDPDETPHLKDSTMDDLLSAPRSRQTSVSTKKEYSLPPPPHRASISLAINSSRGASGRTREMTSSSSTSRSHSPLPGGALGTSYGTESPHYSPARRMRPLQPDDTPLEPYVAPLQDLVSIAMDVLDTSVNGLTARTGTCREIIARVQEVGRTWEEHPQWPGRSWYVQFLLAVAGLSRVVEWWEAERGFWNFGFDGSELDKEPIRFFVGPNQATSAAPTSAGTEVVSPVSSEFAGDPLPPPALTSRSRASNSPVRMIRSATLSQSAAIRTPSQHSSATNSPALEPADRRGTFANDADLLHNSPSSTPGRASSYDHEQIVQAEGADEVDTDVAAPLPTSVKDSQNILMELSLDGERFLYLSPAWQTVIGSDPAQLFDRPIEDVLAPGDAQTFAEATEQLQIDDSHTVEAAFRIVVDPSVLPEDEITTGVRFYQEMEGKGMLMQDRESGQPSHTMWVFKPTGPPEAEADLRPAAQRGLSGGVGDLSIAAMGSTSIDEGRVQPMMSTAPVLCRICERDIPAWFFEKHSEICNEIHRLEMEISENNEMLSELRRTVRAIIEQLEVAGEEPVEYRNVPLTTPAPSSAPPTALEVANRSLSPRHPNPASVRKAHLRALNAIIDILRVASSISTPATKDEAEPIEKQRLLSPESESKIAQVRGWKMMALPSEDTALDLLAADVVAAMMHKLSAVNRMLNTIVYVETVHMEWEQRLEAALAHEQAEQEALAEAVEEETTSLDVSRAGSQAQTLDEEEIADAASSEAGAKVATSVQTLDQHRLAVTETRDEAVDEMDGDTSAILLDQDERDAAAPGSTTLSARDDVGREEDIPAVETDLGGSATHAIPIPISSRASIPPRIRQMARDTSAVSSSSGDDGAGPASDVSPFVAPAVPHSRRESLMSGDRTFLQTPPMSPRHSPLEVSMVRQKDRRMSHSLRAATGMSLNSPLLGTGGGIPLSPRIPPAAPVSRPVASSIKDFDIIKPISKGAFGSVFLTRKRTTGDYYAIKVLKKSDMIAKNQITNVKAERMILMTQTQSPFVVKLYFTFQSTENLYLVMEYLPGGDCANLVKNLGSLPESWTRQFIAEVVNGLEMLHSKGVVHRDMKPDNLLIDQRGHLKLTDFGLSKIGLLGRQSRQLSTPHQGRTSLPGASGGGGSLPQTATTAPMSSSWQQHTKKDSGGSGSGSSAPPQSAASSTFSPTTFKAPYKPYAAPESIANIVAAQPFYVGTPTHPRGRMMSTSTDASDSSGWDATFGSGGGGRQHPPPSASPSDSPRNLFSSITGGGSAAGQIGSGSGAQLRKFVGTPDYLAPESILGLGMDDAAVDWWSLGVIAYEFLHGYPPFHANTPEKVFDNILSRNISWDDEDVECSKEARDLMDGLMCTDRTKRLGVNGAEEIKAHPFFAGIDWNALTDADGPFVPQISDPESTDYFDLRGAVFQDFHNESGKGGRVNEFAKAIEGNARFLEPSRPPTPNRQRQALQQQDSSQADDFGSFSYKNLPGLKQANDEVIKKMRGDQLSSMSAAMMDSHQQQQQQHQQQPQSQQRLPLSASLLSSVGSMPSSGAAASLLHQRHRSASGKVSTPSSYRASISGTPGGPPSPTTSISSQSSVPSKSTAPTSPSIMPFALGGSGGPSSASSHYHMHPIAAQHRRRPSELSAIAGFTGSPMGSVSGASSSGLLINAMERKRSQSTAVAQQDDDMRRTSLPSRLRTASMSSNQPLTERTFTPPWQLQIPTGGMPSPGETTLRPSPGETTLRPSPGATMPESAELADGVHGLGLTSSGTTQLQPTSARSTSTTQLSPSVPEQISCMVAEDNPIASRMLEGILRKLGCHVACVRNGAEALRLAMGETKYSILFVDVTLPIVSGQDVARMIKSTRNANAVTPIVVLASVDKSGMVSTTPGAPPVSAGGGGDTTLDGLLEASGGVFDAVLAKPIDRADVCSILPQFGFQPSAVNPRSGSVPTFSPGPHSARSPSKGAQSLAGNANHKQQSSVNNGARRATIAHPTAAAGDSSVVEAEQGRD